MDRRRTAFGLLGDTLGTEDILNTPVRRGGILPVTEYADRTEFDPTSGLLGALWDAFTAPDRARRGQISEADMIPEAFNFAGSLTLGSLLAPRPTGSVGMGGRAAKALEAQQPQGIRAFHGSPHDFDRFSMDAIGTGEGAQAYGHGLYFAENEGVAKAYREALSDKTDALTPVTFEGRKIGPSAPGISGEDLAARFAAQSGGNARLARAHIRGMYNDPNNLPPAHKEAMRLLTEQPERFASAKYLEPGHMYEVNIKADPEDFLDWDKPLSEQPQVARKLGFSTMSEDAIHNEALRLMDEGNKAAGRQGGWMDDPAIKARIDELQNELDKKAPNVTGENFYRGSTDDDFLHSLLTRGNSLQGRSQELSKAGIPGIRYLDQMSRGAGDGSHNYVVFDDALIEILRKYGLLGPVAGLGAAGLLADDGGQVY